MLQQVNELLRRPSDTEKLNEKTETGWRDVNIQSPIFLLFSYSAGVSEDDENDLYQKCRCQRQYNTSFIAEYAVCGVGGLL